MLLMDKDRLINLIADKKHPVQFIFAGKAHPADNEGKKLIQEIIQLCRREDCRYSMVFLEGLRHEGGPAHGPGLRRVAEHAPAPPGGLRHLGHEGPGQRRAPVLHPGRLVGRGLPGRQLPGLRHRQGRGVRGPDVPGLRGEPHPAQRAGERRHSRILGPGPRQPAPQLGAQDEERHQAARPGVQRPPHGGGLRPDHLFARVQQFQLSWPRTTTRRPRSWPVGAWT